MIWLLLLVIAGLLLVILHQNGRLHKRENDLNYIIHKLEEIRCNETMEQVKVVTDDSVIRELTVQCNLLLDANVGHLSDYLRSQESMRKMLANVSHDLKTPLTVVLGYLELMQMKEKNEHVDVIQKKVNEVLAMMNEFFDLAKLESKDKEYPLEQMELTELARQQVLSFYSKLQEEKAEIEIQIPEKSVYVVSNPDALKRILYNLISNALRYGMDGGYFAFRMVEEEEQIRLQVIDHGKGIDEKFQDKIFERLYTLEDSRSTKYQGSGLGLAITKALAEAIHAKIELHSVPYQETRFELVLKK